MKILAYILVVLNIAASGAFVYFGAQVWKARTEWQYALLKQELANRGLGLALLQQEVGNNGLPLEQAAADADDDTVPIDFEYGAASIERISKKQLAKLIPPGDDVLGVKGTNVVANQTDEVKRVQKIIFNDIDAAARPQKRAQLLVLLLNLAKENGRAGAYALLRDFPDENRRGRARKEIAFLGRSEPQVSALLALSALGDAQLAFAPNVKPEEKATRLLDGRKAIIAWAFSEIPNITPDWDVTDFTKNVVAGALSAIKPEMESATPLADNLETGKKRLNGLLDGELKTPAAQALIPIIADIATNPLDSEEKIAQAKTKLMELLERRAMTDAEKKSLLALSNLLAPGKAESAEKAKEQIEANIDTAASEVLRCFFEEALAKPSSDVPDDLAVIEKLNLERSQTGKKEDQIAGLFNVKSIRDPAVQKLNIAHLLYHLDAHIGAPRESRLLWTKTFGSDGRKAGDTDEVVLKRRIQWHQRVVAIVGLEEYTLVVEAQATQFNRISQRLQARIVEEQNHFENEYEREIAHVKTLARELDARLAVVEAQKANKAEHEALLGIRQAEQKLLEDELAAATAKTKVALQELDVKVAELFEITQQLGAAQDALVGLELKLRDVEIKHGGAK